MTDHRWTVLFIRDDESSVQQYSVSARFVRWLVRAGVFVSVGVAVGVIMIGAGASARWTAHRLQAKNDELTRELAQIRAEVAGLEGSLAELARRDSHLRTLAGLDSIDGEVLRVGVGGPGLATPESSPIYELDPGLASTLFAVTYDLDVLDRRARLLLSSFAEAEDSLQAHHDLLQATPSILPTAGWLSSRFSAQRVHPIHQRPLPHEGVDIAAPKGTPILATANGRVTRAGWVSGYGQRVEIDHGHGIVTFYGHASKVLVRIGQTVSRGEVIAQVGNTGIATSSHLHYEVRVNGRPQNPMNYVLPDVVP